MKKFSIYSHILNHDEKTYMLSNDKIRELTEEERKLIENKKYDRTQIENFIVSFDPVQFSNLQETKEKIDEYIKSFVNEKFSSKYNKKYIDKNGNEKIYTYERLGTFDNSLISVHLNTDNPHIHIVFNKKDKDKNFGKNFSGIRNKLQELNNKFNMLTTDSKNRDENKINFDLKNLEKQLTKFSWAMKKNRDMTKYSSKYINLSNIEEKLNQYINLNGSISFAEGIKKELLEKGYKKNIVIEKTKENIYVSSLISKSNYRKLSEKFITDCKKAKQLNNEIRDFIKSDSKNEFEEILKSKFIELYKESKFTYDTEKKIKIISEKEMNPHIKDLESIINDYEKSKLELIRNKKYLSEKELKYDIYSINIKQKEFENLEEKSISKIIFENNLDYCINNINSYENKDNLKDQIREINSELSEKYIEMIVDKIEEKDFEKEIEIER